MTEYTVASCTPSESVAYRPPGDVLWLILSVTSAQGNRVRGVTAWDVVDVPDLFDEHIKLDSDRFAVFAANQSRPGVLVFTVDPQVLHYVYGRFEDKKHDDLMLFIKTYRETYKELRND